MQFHIHLYLNSIMAQAQAVHIHWLGFENSSLVTTKNVVIIDWMDW